MNKKYELLKDDANEQQDIILSLQRENKRLKRENWNLKRTNWRIRNGEGLEETVTLKKD